MPAVLELLHELDWNSLVESYDSLQLSQSAPESVCAFNGSPLLFISMQFPYKPVYDCVVT